MSSDISKNKNWFVDLVKACWGVVNFTRKAIVNIVFLVLAIVIISAMSFDPKEQPLIFSNNSILELKLTGTIVEERSSVNPLTELTNEIGGASDVQEVLLNDILNAIDTAATDDKISMLKLDVHGLLGASMTHLQEVGVALNRFKETSDKPIIAYGDYYTQAQYYLAAHADQVILNPMGNLIIDGFGRYQMYYKDALDKLKVTSHIFRVGTFKSAVEPYIRNDMSPAAREANEQWLNVLWSHYKKDIMSLRDVNESAFNEDLDKFVTDFESVNGDFAQLALTTNLVDSLMTHQEFNAFVKSKVESDKPSYVSLSDYLSSMSQAIQILEQDKVALVVASGTIYDGNKKPGEIGGHSTAELLKMAREDKDVKAVVLRVNSPGGSAFASEIIRNEIEALKLAGKPVVASMSSVAASGGYWISASADQIWASPTTITGSIGIFGMFMTYENSLAELGLSTDGVGTTGLSGITQTSALPKQFGQVIQMSVEQGYRQFLNLVATERDMTTEQVDQIAQGRVWAGQTAKDIGLVDELGYYDDAIAAAAELAELENYSVIRIKKPVQGFDKIIQDVFGVAKATFGYEPSITNNSKLFKALSSIVGETTQWLEFNDPNHMYIYCIECDAL